MVRISDKRLSTGDVAKIKRDLTVVLKNDYTVDKTYKLYEYSERTGEYSLPLYWSSKNLSIDLKVQFKDLADINPGKLTSSPRPHQLECMKACEVEIQKKWGGGIINMATGSGKTFTALMLVEKIKKKTLIIVHTIDLLQQWTKSIKQFLPECRIGHIQGKKFQIDDVDIVVGMLQTISMKMEYSPKTFENFGLVIYDEVQFLGAEVFSKALMKSRARYTFGLSATIMRKDGLEYVFKNHIGNILYSNISSELKQYTDIRYHYVQELGLKELVTYKGPNIAGMITELSNNKKRTLLIVDEIKKLMTEDGRNILVLSDRVQHLKDLYKLLGSDDCGLFIGEMKEEAKLLSKSKRVLLATYHIASVGFDHPKLNTLVFATPRSTITQAVGRIYRKQHLITPVIVDFIDTFSVFPYQFKKRKKTYSKLINQEKEEECLFE
jgi:superfamily II DNA or RNA helicase